jgi:hypothetical protein
MGINSGYITRESSSFPQSGHHLGGVMPKKSGKMSEIRDIAVRDPCFWGKNGEKSGKKGCFWGSNLVHAGGNFGAKGGISWEGPTQIGK